MNVIEFVREFKEKKIFNSKLNDHAVSDYLKENLEIREYIPFKEKRMIAEMVVANNTDMIDGVKKHDSINAYVSFVVAMLTSHTNLKFGDDPVADYDLLAENGLLMPIIEEFSADYSECDILLKMALSYEMEDNSVGAVIGRFLNGVYGAIDGIGDALKNKIDSIDINAFLGDVNKEDLAKLSGLLDKFK